MNRNACAPFLLTFLCLASCESSQGGTPPVDASQLDGAPDAIGSGDAAGGGINDAATGNVPQAPGSPGCHDVTYSPPSTRPQNAYLCIPDTDIAQLAVVLVHGGGNVQGDRDELVAWQEFFLSQGAVTLNINYFLVQPATPSPVFPLPERNVKAAIQYLRANAARLQVDDKRIVLLGTSAGARLGGVVFTTPNDPYFSGTDLWPGISDRLAAFIGFYGGYDGKLASAASGLSMEQYYGGGPDSSDQIILQRLAKSNAKANAANASGAALLFHGDADELAPPRQSAEFHLACKSTGIDSTLVIVPGAAHSFDRKRSVRRAFTPEGEQAAMQALQWLRMRFGS